MTDIRQEECFHCKGKGSISKDYTCNKCGESCLVNSGDVPYREDDLVYRGIKINYCTNLTSSDQLEMNADYEFRLCEKCIIELFKSFKIKPLESISSKEWNEE